MRFGTSNSLDSSNQDKAAESVSDYFDNKDDPLQQTTNPILSTTQGEN